MPTPRCHRVPFRALPRLLALLALSACATNPVTGERELMLVSEDQEIRMGQSFAPQVEAQMGLVDDAALQAYVSEVGLPMARGSERPNLPWSFGVVDDPIVNAFAAPGGFIYVSRGILAHMNSEAQLAGVLGHEIAHVTARHSAKQMSRQALVGVALALPVAVAPELSGVAQLAGAGLGLLQLSYGRDAERQADTLGLGYMRGDGYDARALIDVMRMLDATTQASGGGGVPEWLATHPNPGNREARLRAELAALPAAPGRDDRAGFLARLRGLVYGPNPREGYFQGARFVHPDMAFEMNFPEGWQTRNTRQAVAGVSPNRDAVIQISGAQQETRAAAADAFLQRQGVTQLDRRQVQQNGLALTVAAFRAESQSGPLIGLVAFAERGSVLQLLAVTAGNQWETHRHVLAASVDSFQVLTDRRALAVQPWRLEVVTPRSAMTPSEFARAYPGPVEAEKLALLNQIPAGGRFAAGVPAKRVVGEPLP